MNKTMLSFLAGFIICYPHILMIYINESFNETVKNSYIINSYDFKLKNMNYIDTNCVIVQSNIKTCLSSQYKIINK